MGKESCMNRRFAEGFVFTVLLVTGMLLLSPLAGAEEQVRVEAQEQAPPGTQEQVPAEAQYVVAVGDPFAEKEMGLSDAVCTFGVLVSEDKVLVPFIAVTERSLAINSGKLEAPNPLLGGDQMLAPAGVDREVYLARKELAPVKRVPMHVWDPDAKKVHTMQATLIAVDYWESLALYQLPEKFPGRAATLYDGDVPDGLKVTFYSYLSFSLKNGPAPQPPMSVVLKTKSGPEGKAERYWGIVFDTGWPMRGAGVFADGKLVGVVPEYTHYRIEPSPSLHEKRRPAVYVILAGRIREFLKEQKVL
jgi:hypothetical protein